MRIHRTFLIGLELKNYEDEMSGDKINSGLNIFQVLEKFIESTSNSCREESVFGD